MKSYILLALSLFVCLAHSTPLQSREQYVQFGDPYEQRVDNLGRTSRADERYYRTVLKFLNNMANVQEEMQIGETAADSTPLDEIDDLLNDHFRNIANNFRPPSQEKRYRTTLESASKQEQVKESLASPNKESGADIEALGLSIAEVEMIKGFLEAQRGNIRGSSFDARDAVSVLQQRPRFLDRLGQFLQRNGSNILRALG